MMCVRSCGAEMRPFYDALGYVIIGHECRECHRTAFTWDQALGQPPAEGEVRRYAPADVPVFRPLEPSAPAPLAEGEQLCAWIPCSRPFTPEHGNQHMCSDACRLARKRSRDVGRRLPRRGNHEAPEMSGSHQ